MDGESDQVTPVFRVPLTTALNRSLWPAVRELEVGLIWTEMGVPLAPAAFGKREMVALAIWLESARLVAVTITVCGSLMLLGALYTPPDILPTEGAIDHDAATGAPLSMALKLSVSLE
jgi:hypothetical protein